MILRREAICGSPVGALVVLLSAVVVPLFTVSGSLATVSAQDWPSWRGPTQNGVSPETNLIDAFDPAGGEDSNVRWMRSELAGISTPIVMHGRLYTLCRSNVESPKEGEKVVCADAATGEVLWENRFNVYLSDVPAERVGWSNVAGDPVTGRVYALGVCGLFQCLDGRTGKTIWSRSLSEEFGMLTTYGGRTNTPVLFEDLVIISGVTTGWGETARPAHRLLAFDKRDGRLVWLSSTRLLPEDTTYSTPVVATLDGQAAIVLGAGDGSVYAMQPRTGQVIWKFDLSRRGINTSPVVVGDRVFIGHSEENVQGTSMGALVAIDGRGRGDITKTNEIWRVDELMVGKSSPLVVGGRLYAAEDSGGFHVLDAATGEPIGRSTKLGTTMRGSLLYADGKIYACTTGGRWWIFQPTEDGVRALDRQRLPLGDEVQGSPIAAGGRVYLPTTSGMYCLGRGDASPAIATPPVIATEAVKETSSGDSVVKHAQLVPAEVLVRPGEQVQYELRLFNARGQLVGSSKAQYTVEGDGAISDAGLFQASSETRHTTAVVAAAVPGSDVVARARVRVVPPLPWTFDFRDGAVPPTWIGADYRHVVREVDGQPALVKISTIPKGTRSQSWMGPVDLSDYTIQADVRGAEQDGKMPDIGLIAQRYTLDLMGEHQQLQIRTWPPQLRMAQTIPFAWEPGVWYTMKFRAALEDGQAVLRGKVWKRGEAEPADWTLTATDAAPNHTGSPGLFGNASNAEITLDNLSVTPN
ncbi:MAG: PQQ-binding-like beta-propeller repeat protein [Pirellulaceae bacterium]